MNLSYFNWPLQQAASFLQGPTAKRRRKKSNAPWLTQLTPVQASNLAICVISNLFLDSWLLLMLQPAALAAFNYKHNFMDSGIVCALLVGALVRCFSVVAKVVIQAGVVYVLTVVYVQMLTNQTIVAQLVDRWQTYCKGGYKPVTQEVGLRKWVATANNIQDVNVTPENALPDVSVQSKPILTKSVPDLAIPNVTYF